MNAGSPPTVLHARAEPLGGALRRSQQLFSSFLYFRLFVYAARGVVFGPLGRACGLVGAVALHFVRVQASKGLESAVLRRRRSSGPNSSFSSPQFALALLLECSNQAARQGSAVRSFVHPDTPPQKRMADASSVLGIELSFVGFDRFGWTAAFCVFLFVPGLPSAFPASFF